MHLPVQIVSYMSMSQSGMENLLANTQREVQRGNLDTRQGMKQVGCVDLHNCEMSA